MPVEAEKPCISRLFGKKKMHGNSIKITVHWWKRYRVLIDFPGGGFTCPLGGFNRVRGGFKFQRGFKVNDWVAPTNWNL